MIFDDQYLLDHAHIPFGRSSTTQLMSYTLMLRERKASYLAEHQFCLQARDKDRVDAVDGLFFFAGPLRRNLFGVFLYAIKYDGSDPRAPGRAQ